MKKTDKAPSLENSITERISGEVSHTYKHVFVVVLSDILSFLAVLLNFSCRTLKLGHDLEVQDISLIILSLCLLILQSVLRIKLSPHLPGFYSQR